MQGCSQASEAAGMRVGARVYVPSMGKTKQDAPCHPSVHAFPSTWFVGGAIWQYSVNQPETSLEE